MASVRRPSRAAVLVVVACIACSILAPVNAAVRRCPRNNTSDFYVDPKVRRPSGLKPTGVARPRVCTFPTLTKGLKKAAALGAPARVIARGGTAAKPAVFTGERFPMSVPADVTVTTADDPSLGGGGLEPGRYLIKFTEKAAAYAISLSADSALRGFTVKNSRRRGGADMVRCTNGDPELEDVVVNGIGRRGRRARTGLVVSGTCAMLAEALTVSGSQSDGVAVGPSGSLTMMDGTIASSRGNGLLVNGEVDATDLEVSSSGINGVLVNTDGDVSLHNFDIHDNVGAGIRVEKVGGQLQTSGERPTLQSLSKVHDNGGHGIAIGGGNADIDAVLTSTDISANERGIDVMDQGLTNTYTLQFLDNDVFSNRSNGMYVAPSTVSFSQNKFHNNGLNQVVFDGGGRGFSFKVDSPSGMCDAGANAVYCYTAKNVFGIFAQNISNVTVMHTQFEGGGTGLKDFSAQSGSTISVSANCTAITICP